MAVGKAGERGRGIGNGNFICGVTAPRGEFAGVVQRLISSLDSYAVTQGYVDNCLARSHLQWELRMRTPLDGQADSH
jgi:hypothetical protein